MAQEDAVVEERTTGVGRRRWLWSSLAFGPGLMVMLADTDVGSVVTAAQSGAQWGYAMVLPQLLLIPVLFLVQEITVRLGVVTGRGHGELIRQRFGLGWALLSVSTLFLSAVGALITEFSGIAGVGSLWGIPPWASVGMATLLMIALGLSGRYRRVEAVGIALGSLELLYLAVAWLAHPSPARLWTGMFHVPLANPGYQWLLAANVGAVIMPWMVFYQQGAVIDKRWTARRLVGARVDTAAGAVVTQLVMLAVVVVTASTLAAGGQGGGSLGSIPQIAQALTPYLGTAAARVVFGLGTLGAGLVAALVVSVAGAWGVGEALGFRHSLNHAPREAPWFYLLYTFAHVAGAVLVIASVNLVQLTVDVEVMNAMLLPVVLGFLLALEAKALPPAYRMGGAHRALAWTASALVMGFGLYITLTSL